jgi:hypothetical protein
VLPRVAHEVPQDLVEVAAVEDHDEVVGRDDLDAAGRDVLGLHDLLAQRAQEVGQRDRLRLLAVAAVELQHLADDAVDALAVVADHREEAHAVGRHRLVLLEELRGLVDRGQRVAHLVRDRRGEPAHRGELHLLRVGLRAAEVLEVDQRPAVEARADAHEPHAQQALRDLDLERRQRDREVVLPARQ